MPSALTLLHCTVTNLLITHSFFLWHSVKKDPSALLSICWLGLVISPLMVFTSYGFNVCVISFGSGLGNLVSCTGKTKLRGLKPKLQADMMGSVDRNWNESVLLRDRDSSKTQLIMNEVNFIVMRLRRAILTSPSPNLAIKYLKNKWWIMQNVTFLASGFIKLYNWICTQRLRLSSFIKKDFFVFLEEEEKKKLAICPLCLWPRNSQPEHPYQLYSCISVKWYSLLWGDEEKWVFKRKKNLSCTQKGIHKSTIRYRTLY